MGKIGKKFENILSKRKKAFIPFFTAFYPNPELFKRLVFIADEVGADFIEIGIPFSDPLADGKTIQYTSQWVLEKGFSFKNLLKKVEVIKKNTRIPLILMSYFNPILKRGIKNFAKEITNAGIDGVIIPDLPLEESLDLKEVLKLYDIDLIYLIAPTSTDDRVKKINDYTDGFIYLVSLTGVTGARNKLPEHLGNYINRVKRIASKPVCVGFGISSPFQAKRVAEISDGIIIGSALMNLIKDNLENKSLLTIFKNFMESLRRAI